MGIPDSAFSGSALVSVTAYHSFSEFFDSCNRQPDDWQPSEITANASSAMQSAKRRSSPPAGLRTEVEREANHQPPEFASVSNSLIDGLLIGQFIIENMEVPG